MNISSQKLNLDKPTFDALVINLFRGEDIDKRLSFLDKETLSLVNKVIDNGDFKAEKNNHFLLYPLSSYHFRILLVGSGEKDKFDINIARENLGSAIKKLSTKKVKTVAVNFEAPQETDKLVQALAEGAVLASFNHEIFKKKDPEKIEVEEIIFDETKANKTALEKGRYIGEAINWVRHLEFQPANHTTPTVFVEEARKLTKENGLKIEVISEIEAKKQGMGGFVAMAQGSDEPSFMVALEYLGKKDEKNKVGLVGKGITFDSGGISIKPGKGMHEMKMDMTGAGNVLAMMKIISFLKLPLNVVAVMPLTENMPSGKAIKPGDVVTALNGKTIEITNTDAEGRVVLGDALVYAQKLGANKILEFSTLTGAVLVALGDITTAVMGTDQDLIDQVLETARLEGEPMWQLPSDDRYKDLIKSHIADMVNADGGSGHVKGAGTIAGAMFLQEFIEKGNQFVHFDIAGTAWSGGSSYLGHGPTGVGVRTTVALLSKLAQK